MSHHRHHHETLHRGESTLDAMRDTSVTVCGAGALGANLTDSLARMGFQQLAVIDFDRIEERNLSTQPYGRRDLGAQKVRILANDVYRAVGVDIEAVDQRLTTDNVDDLLADCDVAVDCFDNSTARGALQDWAARTDTPCLHVGMADGYGEATWNGDYQVPSDSRDDVCDYPLARSLVLLTTGIACEVLADFVADGTRRDVSMTLRDSHARVTEH